EALVSLPGTKVAPPRPSHKNPSEYTPSVEAQNAAQRAPVRGSPHQAKTTVPDKRGSHGREIELSETQAAPQIAPRSSLASHPMVIPSGGPRGPLESGIPIALDEPFATEQGSPDQPETMNKSLTLGDLLSPDELAMLGERLERAQSDAPGSPLTAG